MGKAPQEFQAKLDLNHPIFLSDLAGAGDAGQKMLTAFLSSPLYYPPKYLEAEVVNVGWNAEQPRSRSQKHLD